MGYAERLPLIRQIEQARGSKVLCYLTSLRPGVPGQMSSDAVREICDHLLAFQDPPIDKLDLFLCSNGGDSVLPWRLVPIFREFAKEFAVLVPYHAYSAATILALGANEIVMHPFGVLGPIDPTVTNEFNPADANGRRMGISVEDVKAFVSFVKENVGITHEDELVQMMAILADKVHPLALGNVERFISQSRMIARKLLNTHMDDVSDRDIEDIIETLASRLYCHGHPINRTEAKNELRLEVADNVSPELYRTIWQLYEDFETEFSNRSPFDPFSDLRAQGSGWTLPTPTTPPTPADKEMRTVTHDLILAMVESTAISSADKMRQRFTLVSQFGAQDLPRQEILEAGWVQTPAPQLPPTP